MTAGVEASRWQEASREERSRRLLASGARREVPSEGSADAFQDTATVNSDGEPPLVLSLPPPLLRPPCACQVLPFAHKSAVCVGKMPVDGHNRPTLRPVTVASPVTFMALVRHKRGRKRGPKGAPAYDLQPPLSLALNASLARVSKGLGACVSLQPFLRRRPSISHPASLPLLLIVVRRPSESLAVVVVLLRPASCCHSPAVFTATQPPASPPAESSSRVPLSSRIWVTAAIEIQ